jgi:hypothetical protein
LDWGGRNSRSRGAHAGSAEISNDGRPRYTVDGQAPRLVDQFGELDLTATGPAILQARYDEVRVAE